MRSICGSDITNSVPGWTSPTTATISSTPGLVPARCVAVLPVVADAEGGWVMTECRDCGLTVKHVGDGVWIDHTQGDCCWQTNEPHRPDEDKS